MECSWKRRKAGRQRLGEKWRAHAATCTCARFALRRVNAPPTRLVVAIVATAASASAIKKEKRTRDDEVGERWMGRFRIGWKLRSKIIMRVKVKEKRILERNICELFIRYFDNDFVEQNTVLFRG